MNFLKRFKQYSLATITPTAFATLILTATSATQKTLAGTTSSLVNTSIFITGFRDGNGNILSSQPIDVTLTGQLFGPTVVDESTSGNANATVSGTGNIIISGSPVGSGPTTLNLGDGFSFQSTAIASVFDLLTYPTSQVLTGIETSFTLLGLNTSNTTGYFVDGSVAIDYTLSTDFTPSQYQTINTGFDFVLPPTNLVITGLNISRRIVSQGVVSDTANGTFSMFIPASGGAGFGAGQGVGAKVVVNIPEPSSILSLLTLGTLGAASTLKRQLKPSKSSEKETTKVS